MREAATEKRLINTVQEAWRRAGRVLRTASYTSGALTVALLAVCVLFSSTAKAACNPRENVPVKVSNWTKFLTDGLSAGAPAPTSGQGADPSIVGMWHVFLVSGGQPFDEGFEQWHSDGTEIFNDIAPPQAANGSGAVCLGVYEKSGPGTYKLNHIGWLFDANANLAGMAVLTETATMDMGGNTYHGTFDFKVYDLSQNLVFEAKGTISATRVKAT